MSELEPQSKPAEFVVKPEFDVFDFSSPLVRGLEDQMTWKAIDMHARHYRKVLDYLEGGNDEDFYRSSSNNEGLDEWTLACGASDAVRAARNTGLSDEDIREETTSRLTAIDRYYEAQRVNTRLMERELAALAGVELPDND